MIWKVLKNNIKASQLAGTFLGIMLGLTILMGALSFYLDVKPIFDDKESFWKDEYIIINKKIELTDTYQQINDANTEKPLFTVEEINDLKKQPFVKDVAEFSNCSFMISASTNNEGPLAGFYTDLFFEAVPDEYVDVNYENWKWEENDEFVPAILPKTYLNLYNFGFAQSQNLPQVSEEGAGLVKFNIFIQGNGKKQKFETRIIGFSERINTILVPKSFIDWGNENYGEDPAPRPGRIIIIAKDPSSPELFKYIQDHDYDLNKSELSNSKALAFLKIIISVVLVIGLIIITLAFSLMIISIQLLLHRNNENITKLSMLGYSLKEISRPYQILVIILFAVTFLTSIIPLSIFRNFYSSNLILLGYENFNKILLSVMSPGFGFTIIIVLLLILMIRNSIRRIISKN
ncbi:MAG: ABC transporter permease [Bacteroidales bacterium]|nr:ABC transporter permease [Bacteroidales bacterium]